MENIRRIFFGDKAIYNAIWVGIYGESLFITYLELSYVMDLVEWQYLEI
jgi:hypothetical protein